MPTIPPYKFAELWNSDKPINNNPNDRWIVSFKIWHKEKNCLVRKRDYRVNQYKTKAERLAFAKKLIKEINQKLAEGYMISDRKKEAPTATQKSIDPKIDYSVEQAFDLVLPLIKKQKRKATYNSYKSAADIFLEYCRLNNWQTFNIKSICKQDIINWLNHGQLTRGISNTTRNNNVNQLRPVFTAMKDNGMITENPAIGIPLLDEEEPTRIAFTPEQVKALKEAIFPTNPRLWLFIQFIAYGFIRPKEIGMLRVKWVDMEKGQIYIPGSVSKNKKSAHVKISKAFAGYLKMLHLEDYAPDDYIFGKKLATCSYELPRSSAYKMHAKYLEDLKFPDGYDLYCWKPTGVIMHYDAGVGIKSLQLQLRHSSLDETDKYLRSLGRFANTEIEDKSPFI